MVCRIAVVLLILGNVAPPIAAQDRAYSAAEIRASGGTLPNGARCDQFVIPATVRESGVSGTLDVVYVVAADGTVSLDEIIVVESPHPDATEAAQVHLLNCRFTPGRLGTEGPAVSVVQRMTGRVGEVGPPPGATPATGDRETGIDGPPVSGRALRDIHSLEDPNTMVTERPKRIHCPYYDPQARPTRSRASDRYARRPDLERMPSKIEAVLELVIGTDGLPERRLSRVKRTTDPRLNETLLQWAQSCRWEPGMVGTDPVRVRIDFPVTFTFTRG